jgi:hypothetical protein
MPDKAGGDMDEFLDRMLMERLERRTLDQALADLLVRQNCIPSNRRRNMLEHMIDGLKAEIALRTTATGVAK